MIDFHDYWTDVSYYDMFYRLPCSRKRDARLEKEVIAECDQAITHCRSSRRILAEKTAVPSHEKVNVITMAYDEQLLSRPSEPPQDRLAITYTGTIADFYEPAVLFRALGRLMRKYPQAPVEVRLVGVVGEQVQQLVQEEGLTEVVTETGYVPRRTAVDYLMTSSAIVMINPYFKNERYHVPGKIYEYLASHKPILNIAPIDGETAEIIRECGAGQTFERHMEEELLAYLEGLYSQWQANPDLDVKGNEACVRQFAYNQEGDKLARILRGMQARDPALTASS
jgi:glycosyltransferase involved in cell wall biosynthesis